MTETRESLETLMKLQIWLHRYWRWVLALIVLIFVVMGVAGYLQHAKQTKLENALLTYQTQFKTVNADNLTAAQAFSKAEDNLYGRLTDLEIAQFYVDQKNYPQALAVLQSALAIEKDSFLTQVIEFRIARLQFALNEYTASLTTLNQMTDPNWQALVNNLKGDIYVAMKNYPVSKQAYEQALGNQEPSQFNSLVAMKLNQVDAWIEQ